MKRFLFPILGTALLLTVASCGNHPKFTVKGQIDNAKNAVVYFEQNALDGTVLLDSAVLGANGQFQFKAEVPECPDFYRIRLDKRSIVLGIDTAAQIFIHSDSAGFNTGYTIQGSDNCLKIQELAKLQRRMAVCYDSLESSYLRGEINKEVFTNSAEACIKGFKDQAKPYIYENTKSPVAYFALYQRLHQYLIFDPTDREDSKLFAAVATAWNVFYPGAKRSENLVRLTKSGLAQVRRQSQSLDNIEIKEIDKLSYFEIVLPNIFGQNTALSSLEGKVIMLDFTAFQTDYSAERTLAMRELYRMFEGKGFEIYQVSLDNDEHFWRTAAFSLPWICVRDRNSLASAYAQKYNVRELPTYFLIDKQGHLAARDESIQDLAAEITRLLNE